MSEFSVKMEQLVVFDRQWTASQIIWDMRILYWKSTENSVFASWA